MDNTAHLLWSVFFGSLGVAFFLYGRKQKSAIPLLAGIGLFLAPSLFANVYALVAVGCGLVALPYFIRI